VVPVATFFEHLAHENTAKSRARLVEAERVADVLGLDHEVIDAPLIDLGLESKGQGGRLAVTPIGQTITATPGNHAANRRPGPRLRP
jgi:hypothetical protein